MSNLMSRVTKNIAVALLLSAGLTPLPAFAAESGASAGSGRGGYFMQRLKRMDTDKNNAVSKPEFLAERVGEFKSLDTNRDNSVDGTEIGASLAEPAQFRTKRFVKRVDANHDGNISREEFEQGPRAAFAGRDLNSDGKIDAADKPPSSGTGFVWFSGGQGGKIGLGSGSGRRREQTLERVVARTEAEFAKIDSNSDGALDATELAKQSDERIEFSKKRMMHWSDQNKDGKLTEEEYSARVAKRFATLDLNDDGQIDGNDFPSNTRKGWLSR